ncbi:MAG TPA: hypothetical protein ENJ10_10645 [Caldithrix abyssi]|uniref:GHMP kinase N-terminal domain-containing protein n=1 Tax=Caldithrix abyssi TaxID=187145 RepID=A0A7V1LNA1_CALAY|nr:hypothetical protein [Caldithrix abyssi]
MLQARAPGKLILIGEYAVLEGAPALVAAVNRYSVVSISPSEDEQFYLDAPTIRMNNIAFRLSGSGSVWFPGNLSGDQQKRLHFFKVTFEYAMQYLHGQGVRVNPARLLIDTGAFFDEKIKAKLGFGSSAALTVSVIKALFNYTGLPLREEEDPGRLFRLALAAHRRAQNGMGSGIDVAASSFGGVLSYRVAYDNRARQIMPQAVSPWTELPMLCVFSGGSESTRRMVGGVSRLGKKNPGLYKRLMEILGTVSGQGIAAYTQRDIGGFMEAVDRYHRAMERLGMESGMPIISPVHRQLAETVRKAGGVYKPSGAGSGDIGLAFTRDETTRRQVQGRLEDAGFRCVDIAIDRSAGGKPER